MSSNFRFFQASFSATLLKSAALAIALLVQASPARAEVVTLVCQQSEANQAQLAWGSSFTLRINYDQKIVYLLGPDGSVWFSAAATITESDVRWGNWALDNRDDATGNPLGFLGSLNRLSGEGVASFMQKGGRLRVMSGPCRRATQKF